MQNGIVKDSEMKLMLDSRVINKQLVISWMRDYGLFQGIKTIDREAIVNKYAALVFDATDCYQSPNTKQIEVMFHQFLSEFYETVPRKWLSATSKLLWCSFPDNIVIYDAFVERALVILQGVTLYLADMPRIKTSPVIKTPNDIDLVVEFYLNYQGMVIAIMAEHQKQLNKLRSKYNETYSHDIRIIDKVLWMLGNPNQTFELNNSVCNA